MRHNLASAIGLCGVIFAGAGAPGAELQPAEFDFANAQIGDWSLRAETEILWGEEQDVPLPSVEDVHCFGQSPDADFNMNAAGALDYFLIRFRGPKGEEGERREITLLGDRLWLFINGERWEYANISSRSIKFLNFNYPNQNNENVIVMPVWRGYRAVRRSPEEPWTNLSLFQDKLISANKLEWAFKSRDWSVVDRKLNELPDGWQKTRYPIDNSRWRDAVNWCSRQVASDEARSLPIDLLKAPQH